MHTIEHEILEIENSADGFPILNQVSELSKVKTPTQRQLMNISNLVGFERENDFAPPNNFAQPK